MNKTTKKKSHLTVALVLGIALIGSVFVFAKNDTVFSFSEARPQVVLNLDANVTRNNETLSLKDIESVKPDEVLHWTITSENKGEGDAKNYKTVGNIPTGTEYIKGTASADGSTVITYSIDGGKTYAKEPMIEEKQSDGSVKLVPAPVSQYTQIQYEWTSPLEAKGKLNASYDVKVK